VSTSWLLALHITGAFLFVGGSVAAGALNVLAWRAERPSETALLLGLIRRSVPVIGVGSVLAFVFGLWLVHRTGASFGAFWIWAAIVLWVVANALGGRGGRAQEKAREEAVRCAADGDVPTDRLRELVRDPTANALSWAAGVATVLILVLMIWKPGS
jgi:uncharacterized membrane protein